MATERVAILVIGNEILSGDTHEGNAHFMARRLAGRGIQLGRIVVIPDDVAEIARHVAELAAEFDVVISCGGIGPTHDDVTMEGVARAFGVELEENAELRALLVKWRGENLDESMRRLTLVPRGAELIWTDKRFPSVRMRNVYVLPGVPRLCQEKFDGLLERWEGAPHAVRQFRVEQDELSVAEALRRLQERFPEVSIGSYPHSPATGAWELRLVLTAGSADALDRASAALREAVDKVSELAADEEPTGSAS